MSSFFTLFNIKTYISLVSALQEIFSDLFNGLIPLTSKRFNCQNGSLKKSRVSKFFSKVYSF